MYWPDRRLSKILVREGEHLVKDLVKIARGKFWNILHMIRKFFKIVLNL